MESFTSEYSYESFEDYIKQSEQLKQFRLLIANNIKSHKKLPILIDITQFYKDNESDMESMLKYMNDELKKLNWSVELHDDTDIIQLSLDKLDSSSDDTCNIV
jgi:hypothetical protein